MKRLIILILTTLMVILSASTSFYTQNYATPKFHTNTLHLKGNYDHRHQEVKNATIEQLNLQDSHAKPRFKVYLLLDSKDNVTKLRVYIRQFRARYYSDELGRFISRYPMGYVDDMSLYAGYFAQRFAVDPSGKVLFYVEPPPTPEDYTPGLDKLENLMEDADLPIEMFNDDECFFDYTIEQDLSSIVYERYFKTYNDILVRDLYQFEEGGNVSNVIDLSSLRPGDNNSINVVSFSANLLYNYEWRFQTFLNFTWSADDCKCREKYGDEYLYTEFLLQYKM